MRYVIVKFTSSHAYNTPCRVHRNILIIMSTGKFINILTQLRGPEISIEDIEWLDEFPVGKDVIEFLVSQVEENEVMLTDIALDREENEMYVASKRF